MPIARNGLYATRFAANSQTRSVLVALAILLAIGGCAKKEGAASPESAEAAAAQSSPVTATDPPAPAAPDTIPEPFRGTWASTQDACKLIEAEGLEPAVTITANEVRDLEYETFCNLHKVVNASATELAAEFVCPTPEDRTPAPAPRTLALAAGRLVFQDRPVSYIRCSSAVPPPPVELAEPITPPAVESVDGTTEASNESEVTKPRIASSTQPEYPEAALQVGEQGTVTLDALVQTTGGVSDVRISNSSGSETLDQAAVEAVERSWTFHPGTEHGKPIAMRHRFAVTFKLTGDQPASAGPAGGPGVYQRCLAYRDGPMRYTRLRLDAMGNVAAGIDRYANGQYEQYQRMDEMFSYMERNPNATPDSLCRFAELIPLEAMEQTLRQLAR
jgi:TonB family protein